MKVSCATDNEMRSVRGRFLEEGGRVLRRGVEGFLKEEEILQGRISNNEDGRGSSKKGGLLRRRFFLNNSPYARRRFSYIRRRPASSKNLSFLYLRRRPSIFEEPPIFEEFPIFEKYPAPSKKKSSKNPLSSKKIPCLQRNLFSFSNNPNLPRRPLLRRRTPSSKKPSPIFGPPTTEPMAIFDQIFGSEDRRWGGFFDLRTRRSKMGVRSSDPKIEGGGGLRSSDPKIEDGGGSSIFGPEERRTPPSSKNPPFLREKCSSSGSCRRGCSASRCFRSTA